MWRAQMRLGLCDGACKPLRSQDERKRVVGNIISDSREKASGCIGCVGEGPLEVQNAGGPRPRKGSLLVLSPAEIQCAVSSSQPPKGAVPGLGATPS